MREDKLAKGMEKELSEREKESQKKSISFKEHGMLKFKCVRQMVLNS